MEPSNNDLQQKTNENGEGLVDNEKTTIKGVSPNAERPVRGLDWTAILARNGLESPGYAETVEQMRKDGAIKNSRYT
jgi:hypothetical protein